MKKRFCAVLLAALALSVFTGCSAHALQQLDTAEEVIDRRLDIAGEAIENRIEAAFTDAAIPKAPTPVTPQEPAAAPAPSAVDHAAKISKEEAVAIALNHAGLSEDQVTRLHADLDYDDGHSEYDVDFRHDGYEYDYEIHAETGKILSWDQERDD